MARHDNSQVAGPSPRTRESTGILQKADPSLSASEIELRSELSFPKIGWLQAIEIFLGPAGLEPATR